MLWSTFRAARILTARRKNAIRELNYPSLALYLTTRQESNMLFGPGNSNSTQNSKEKTQIDRLVVSPAKKPKLSNNQYNYKSTGFKPNLFFPTKGTLRAHSNARHTKVPGSYESPPDSFVIQCVEGLQLPL